MRLLLILISLWVVVEVTSRRRRGRHAGAELKPGKKLLEYTYRHSDLALWDIKRALLNKRIVRDYFQTRLPQVCQQRTQSVVYKLHANLQSKCGFYVEEDYDRFGTLKQIDRTARKVLSALIPGASKKILLSTLNEFVTSKSIGSSLVSALYQNVNHISAENMEILTAFLYKYKTMLHDGALDVIASVIKTHPIDLRMLSRVEHYLYYFERRFDVMQPFIPLPHKHRPGETLQHNCIWHQIKKYTEELYLEIFQRISCTMYGEEITNISVSESSHFNRCRV